MRGVCVCVCGVCVCVCVSWWVCVFLCGAYNCVRVCVVCACLCVGVCLSCMVVCRLVKHVSLYMHFVALLDYDNSKIKMFREKQLHLKCSPDRYLLIKPSTKKIKRVVKKPF